MRTDDRNGKGIADDEKNKVQHEKGNFIKKKIKGGKRDASTLGCIFSSKLISLLVGVMMMLVTREVSPLASALGSTNLETDYVLDWVSPCQSSRVTRRIIHIQSWRQHDGVVIL